MIEQLEAINFETDILPFVDLNSLNDKELCELYRQEQIIKFYHEKFPIIYFQPQEYQEPFFASRKKIRAIFGGNQSGKTISGTNEGLRVALGIDPYKKLPVPNRGRIGTTDLQKGIGEDIQVHLDRWMPMLEVSHIKKYPGGQTSKVFFKNGSVIDFLSYEQEDKIWEGWAGDWVFLNECPPREKYISCRRGLLKSGGLLWFALTPLEEPWLWDEIYLKGGTEDIDVWNYDTYKNKYLSPEEIKKFEESLSPEEKEARLHGKPRHLFGLVYKEFNPEIHCINSSELPKDWEDWTFYFSMDFHPRTECACFWLAVSPSGTFYAVDELWLNGTIEEMSEKIKALTAKRQTRVRFIDPLSATPERSGDKITTARREFMRYGLPMRPWIKDFSTGINAVRQALKVGNDGKPGIYFVRDRVPMMIQGMTHYQWDEYKDDDMGARQTVKKQYSHFPDALRGILISRPTYLDLNARKLAEAETYRGNKITGYGH